MDNASRKQVKKCRDNQKELPTLGRLPGLVPPKNAAQRMREYRQRIKENGNRHFEQNRLPNNNINTDMDKNRHKQIMNLYEKGRRLSDIARDIGVSISTVQRTIKNSLAQAEPATESSSAKPVKRAKIVIRSSKDNHQRYFVLREKPGQCSEVIVPDANVKSAAELSIANQNTKEIGTAVVNQKGVRVGTFRTTSNTSSNTHNFQKLTGVNSSLERGLKIFAATVAPDVQKAVLGETVKPGTSGTSGTSPNISIKSSNGLLIKPVVNTTEQTNFNTLIPRITGLIPVTQATNKFTVSQGISNNTTPSLQVNTGSIPVRLPISLNGNLNGINTNSRIILAPTSNITTSVQQNNNIIYSLAQQNNMFYRLPGGTLSPVVVKPPSPPPSVPKIAAVHSQFTPESLNEIKISKADFICKDIEANPSLYLGVGKKELHILKLLSNGFQLTQKQMFIILRKLRHNEPVDILADLFEISGEEIVQTITDNVPRIAAIFRKGMEVASKSSPAICVVDQLRISIRKGSYLSEQPEEICRNSTKMDLKYLVSCTHSGLINFVSQGYEMHTKYSNVGNLCKFLKSVNPATLYIVRNGLSKIDEKYLHYKNVKLQKSVGICYRMNVIRAFDAIKQFKLLSNTEIPLRQEIANIIDDYLLIACALYNCKSL